MLLPITSRPDWQTRLAALPSPHLLQTWDWGDFKTRYGWTAQRFIWERDGQTVAAASVLRRAVPASSFLLPSSILYISKGPLLDWRNAELRREVLSGIETLARRERAIFVKIDPDVGLGTGIPQTESDRPDPLGAQLTAELARRGWRPSTEQIQFRNTARLDLTRSEAGLLAAMKQKTRYNIRLADKKGVRVRLGDSDDLDLLYRMYAETSVRDGFTIRSPEYYRDAWGAFVTAGLAQPFVAEVEGQTVAAILVFQFGGTATYMYGMSREAHREKMPNHLLQWEAIRWAKARGCAVYDFWGAPDRFDETDRLWGVWRFKEGFGGEVVRTIGAWDFPVSKLWYWFYTTVVPRYLDLLRRRGRRLTKESLADG
ncbi:MAG: peptidoglycan bridge formation glycyltransferase FemA/FemB family protein [Chloroflexi bacterium]|nr:peptidoglycan bridge formation glycyltransferase FemA/FemB family protein [Chloroflexota bacterium]